jgi:hypothetical protein
VDSEGWPSVDDATPLPSAWSGRRRYPESAPVTLGRAVSFRKSHFKAKWAKRGKLLSMHEEVLANFFLNTRGIVNLEATDGRRSDPHC